MELKRLDVFELELLRLGVNPSWEKEKVDAFAAELRSVLCRKIE